MKGREKERETLTAASQKRPDWEGPETCWLWDGAEPPGQARLFLDMNVMEGNSTRGKAHRSRTAQLAERDKMNVAVTPARAPPGGSSVPFGSLPPPPNNTQRRLRSAG